MVKTKRFLMLGLAIMLAFAMLVGVLAPVKTVEAETTPVSVSDFIAVIGNAPTRIYLDSYETGGSYDSGVLGYNIDSNDIDAWAENADKFAQINSKSDLEDIMELLCDASGNPLNYATVFGSSVANDYSAWLYEISSQSSASDVTNGIYRNEDEEDGSTMLICYIKAPSNSTPAPAGAGVETNILVATLSVIVLGTAITLLSVKKQTNK